MELKQAICDASARAFNNILSDFKRSGVKGARPFRTADLRRTIVMPDALRCFAIILMPYDEDRHDKWFRSFFEHRGFAVGGYVKNLGVTAKKTIEVSGIGKCRVSCRLYDDQILVNFDYLGH